MSCTRNVSYRRLLEARKKHLPYNGTATATASCNCNCNCTPDPPRAVPHVELMHEALHGRTATHDAQCPCHGGSCTAVQHCGTRVRVRSCKTPPCPRSVSAYAQRSCATAFTGRGFSAGVQPGAIASACAGETQSTVKASAVLRLMFVAQALQLWCAPALTASKIHRVPRRPAWRANDRRWT